MYIYICMYIYLYIYIYGTRAFAPLSLSDVAVCSFVVFWCSSLCKKGDPSRWGMVGAWLPSLQKAS